MYQIKIDGLLVTLKYNNNNSLFQPFLEKRNQELVKKEFIIEACLGLKL